ncbi:hypothetical protein F0562_012831 [Nyssa sinensis]|uniref:Uncharacterized protein n=1 Tax=Nyssa sinensis TaxID=561372 RepID=A0A5J4ZWT9_9ASTE|nr:hypothetical protein F0562_012831 [Nyssa sinensis]
MGEEETVAEIAEAVGNGTTLPEKIGESMAKKKGEGNDGAKEMEEGFEEIIPLNPGNTFSAEDSHPVPKWENINREILNKIQPKTNFKCYSDPFSIKVGTPICIPQRDFIDIGCIASIENNHKPVDYAKKGQKVPIKV